MELAELRQEAEKLGYKLMRGCINPPGTCVRCAYNMGNNECNVKTMTADAAAAIEALEAAWIKLETDATNLTGRLAQAEADVERLNREIDKRIATEIELSNRCDALEPKRGEMYFLEYDNPETGEYEQTYFQCSVCGKYFYALDECEVKHFNYCPNCGAKMEVQE